MNFTFLQHIIQLEQDLEDDDVIDSSVGVLDRSYVCCAQVSLPGFFATLGQAR